MLTFEEAIKQSKEADHRHVLLGNGFSRACRDDIFAYDALFERADFRSLSQNAKIIFEALDTTDFEVAINALRTSAQISRVYASENPAAAESMESDAEALREVLVSAIAGSHPARPNDINIAQYAACKQFLAHFDRIFTLNYDLLLYWATMQLEIEPAIMPNDGFRTPEYGEAPYVTWEIEESYGQKIYYLHGALHLFDAGFELQKYTWANTGIPLTEQIKEALAIEKYPMFVAEGSSAEKLEKIKHHAYLTKAFESFSRIGGVLFAYGHSFASNDEHVLHLIEKGRVEQLYVGIFGDPESRANKSISARAERMREYRFNIAAQGRKRPELEVFYYDASTAEPWGSNI